MPSAWYREWSPTSARYQGRPAAADIAFSIAAFSDGWAEEQIERALEDDYLSRDPSPSRRAAYIRGTMAKAKSWAERSSPVQRPA